ncbi:MAG: S-layer homology domain-containing protein [Candidatus Margulisiibacteriota bacterium]|nr:S-layer homology domain-containing protein [Candidatus Margulisiibacteriota bacterium]
MKKPKSKIQNPKFIIGILFVICYLTFVIPGALAQGGMVSDPMSIGVGARSIGMGRSYVGVAEGSDALFMNPAGIARAVNPKLSSMYCSLLNDVNYAVVGGVYPYGDKSAIGAGIINSYTGGISLTDSDGTLAGDGAWSSTVLFISGATYLNTFPALRNVDKDVLIGGSFKYHSVGGSGSNDVASLGDAAGTGYSADLGLLYPATDYLTLGLNYQNVLASKLTRSTGRNEDIPSNLKLGAKFNVLGREGESYTTHNTRRLYLNLDYDTGANINDNDRMHYGLEFWPVSNLAFRTGVDGQDITAGIGVRLAGIEFNYAYHPYSGIPDNATSFFSISYMGEARKRELRVHIDSPKDKSVIYDDHVEVSGYVEVIAGDETQAAPGRIAIKANGVSIPLGKDLKFSADIPVDKVGKKLVVFEATDTAGDYTAKDFRMVRLVNFDDVPEGYWAQAPIENTGTVGLVEGYPDGTFKPERALTRAELATLLVRAKGLKLPNRSARKVFKDVKPTFWAAKYIEVAKREGLVKGYPDKTFRPNNKINKAEGIAVLVRFDNLKVASEVFEKPYWDVPANYWASKYIQAAKGAGMLKFVKRNYLHPKTNLPRSESVEMLSTTALAGGKIKDLYTWEKGFRRENIPTRPQLRGSLPVASL